MVRTDMREKVVLLRRVPDDETSGGGQMEQYEAVAIVSACVRDEKWTSSDESQSERLVDEKIVTMRAREIPRDACVLWRGEVYAVRYIDQYQHRGREMKLHVQRTKSRYTLPADPGERHG